MESLTLIIIITIYYKYPKIPIIKLKTYRLINLKLYLLVHYILIYFLIKKNKVIYFES